MMMIKDGMTSRGMNGDNFHNLPTYSKKKYVEICAKSGAPFGVIQ